MLTYTSFFDNFGFEIWFMPITLLMWAVYCFFRIIFSKRIKKTDDINRDNNEFFQSKYGFTFFIILCLYIIIYSLVFTIPYIFSIYFFQLFLMIKLYRQKLKDKANNIIRY